MLGSETAFLADYQQQLAQPPQPPQPPSLYGKDDSCRYVECVNNSWQRVNQSMHFLPSPAFLLLPHFKPVTSGKQPFHPLHTPTHPYIPYTPSADYLAHPDGSCLVFPWLLKMMLQAAFSKEEEVCRPGGVVLR